MAPDPTIFNSVVCMVFQTMECCFKKPTVFSMYTLGIMGEKTGNFLAQVLMLSEALGHKLHHNWAGGHLHLTWARV
jgi:hypothetical protein